MPALDDDALNRAYRYATALCGDRDAAMDLVHSAYVKFVRYDGPPPREPLHYFLRMIRNGFLDERRHAARWRWEPLEAAEGPTPLHAQDLEAMQVDRDLVTVVWTGLSGPEREVLFLWAVEEHTVDEIAAMTDTPRGTLLARLHRLRKKFQRDGVHGTLLGERA